MPDEDYDDWGPTVERRQLQRGCAVLDSTLPLSTDPDQYDDWAPTVERRQFLKVQIKKYQEELDEIDDLIKRYAQPGELLLDHAGVGYRLSVQKRTSFPPEVTDILSVAALKELASISKPKLDLLKKNALLTWEEYTQIMGLAKERETLVITEYSVNQSQESNQNE